MGRGGPLDFFRTTSLFARAINRPASPLPLPFIVSILHDALGFFYFCVGATWPHAFLSAGKFLYRRSAFPLLEVLVPSRRIMILRATDTLDPPRERILVGSPVSSLLAGDSKASPSCTLSGHIHPSSSPFRTPGAKKTIGRRRCSSDQGETGFH